MAQITKASVVLAFNFDYAATGELESYGLTPEFHSNCSESTYYMVHGSLLNINRYLEELYLVGSGQTAGEFMATQ